MSTANSTKAPVTTSSSSRIDSLELENLDLRAQIEALRTSQSAQALNNVERQLFETRRKLDFAQHNLEHQLMLAEEARESEKKRLTSKLDSAQTTITTQNKELSQYAKLLKHITITQYAKLYRARQACARALIRLNAMNTYVVDELVDHQDRPGGAAYANAFELDALTEWMKHEHERFSRKREKMQAKIKEEDKDIIIPRPSKQTQLASLPLSPLLNKLEECLGMQDLNMREMGQRLMHWHETSNSFLERQMELLNDTRKKGGQLRHCMEKIGKLEEALEEDKKIYSEDHAHWKREFRMLQDMYTKADRTVGEQQQLLDRKNRLIIQLEDEVHDYKLIVKSLQGFIDRNKLLQKMHRMPPPSNNNNTETKMVMSKAPSQKRNSHTNSGGRKHTHTLVSPKSQRNHHHHRNNKHMDHHTNSNTLSSSDTTSTLMSLPYLKEYVRNLGENIESIDPSRPIWRKGSALTEAKQRLLDELYAAHTEKQENEEFVQTQVPVRNRINNEPPYKLNEPAKNKRLISIKPDDSRPSGIYPTVEVIVSSSSSSNNNNNNNNNNNLNKTDRQPRVLPPKASVSYSLRKTT